MANMVTAQGSEPSRSSVTGSGPDNRGSISLTAAAVGSEGAVNSLLPSVALPKGGGAIRGLGEKFDVNAVTGSGSATVPIRVTHGRSNVIPNLALHYDSTTGNGVFGCGWQLSTSSITRKTDKGLPRYRNNGDPGTDDVFIMSGGDDLVPVLKHGANATWKQEEPRVRIFEGASYHIERFRPRMEEGFHRIERWTNDATKEIHWATTTKDNITSIYGRDQGSRIQDPFDEKRVFSWLICETRDDRGNAMVYEYKDEDSTGVYEDVWEQNRSDLSRSSGRHLKRIKYCNRVSTLVQPNLSQAEWLLELVFDYGEHNLTNPKPTDSGPWLRRNDPFSVHRPGFEVRTYRLCQRILLFHHFPNEANIGANCLVRSMDLSYRRTRGIQEDSSRGNPVLSFLDSITEQGYVRNPSGNGYLAQSMPPLEFTYSEPHPSYEVQMIDEDSLANLPVGLSGSTYHWVDVDGEGISGFLAQQPGSKTWAYKSNLGNGTFGPSHPLPSQPSVADLSKAGLRQQFLDLSGEGRADVALFGGSCPGYSKRTFDSDWSQYTAFQSLPIVNWSDHNLQFIDLTGDGHADLLLSEQGAFIFYLSLAEDGFSPGERIALSADEETGPYLIFADLEHTVFVADMSGDGLLDIVRIRNGDVCYWPNQGYGSFGAKVAMGNAPCFDSDWSFDPTQIRLADIDGSGCSDLIYLKSDTVTLFFNLSGNGWSPPLDITTFPPVDNLKDVRVIDFIGGGTACLVWSSSLPGDSRQQMQYIDLMGPSKPHLLTSIKNNMGSETRVTYSTSTKFYLKDKLADTPWVTRISFPIHVVEQVDILDWIGRGRFTARYAYHHGFYDGLEREFRGFGLVEKWETEEFGSTKSAETFTLESSDLDATSNVPPVLTKTWFHTGSFLIRDRISTQFESEYYRGPGDVPAKFLQGALLEDTIFPDSVRLPDGAETAFSLSSDEMREACRSLKAFVLREEVYALDGTDQETHPYHISERNYTIELIQPKGVGLHAVLHAHPRESVELHFERGKFTPEGTFARPRTTHDMVLKVDNFGNVLDSVNIAYGRVESPDSGSLLTPADVVKQERTIVLYQAARFTHSLDEADGSYRGPVLYDDRTFELIRVADDSNLNPTLMNLIPFKNMVETLQFLEDGTHDLDFEDESISKATENHAYRRIVEHHRTTYRSNDLMSPLALGSLQSMALPYEQYQLCLTPDSVTRRFVTGGKMSANTVQTILSGECGYVHSEDQNWWRPSGRVFFSPVSSHQPSDELSYARTHFFLPCRHRDPFHTDSFDTETAITYDSYDLLISQSRTPLGNCTTVGERGLDADLPLLRHGHDYRTMQPLIVMDPNRNRSTYAYDALGIIAGTAVMGKPEESLGDTLDDFNAVLSDQEIARHIQDPLDTSADVLSSATTRFVYDVLAFHRTREDAHPQPVVISTVARGVHSSDLKPGQKVGMQQTLKYIDGLGREIQGKREVGSGVIPRRDFTTGQIIMTDSEPETTSAPVASRWICSDWTIFSSKGNVVQKYEPFFTDLSKFEYAVNSGVSTVLFYDPLHRPIATLHADHTWSKEVVGAWQHESWDANDTALIDDPRRDPDVGAFFRRLPTAFYVPTWYGKRNGGALGHKGKDIASSVAVLANTPRIAYCDSLGHTVLSIEQNRFKYSDSPTNELPKTELVATRTTYDVEGNIREVKDNYDRTVVHYDYDLSGRTIYHASAESGSRWTLYDANDDICYSWDSRLHQYRYTRDQRRRSLGEYLTEGTGPEILVRLFEYGETLSTPEVENLRGKLLTTYDQAGNMRNDKWDFKGNLLVTGRAFAQEYKQTLDWQHPVPLEDPPLVTQKAYDALNRVIEFTQPDGNVIRSTFNKIDRVETIDAKVQHAGNTTPLAVSLDYNAKGQVVSRTYQNGIKTMQEYDRLTSRLTKVVTRRDPLGFPADCPSPASAAFPGCQVQNLTYAYDPVGNVTSIRDDAQQAVYFRNKRVDPSNEYRYDALYQLIEASGREHLGQQGGRLQAPSAHNSSNSGQTRLAHPNDGNAMANYVERYRYDKVGNLKSMEHRSGVSTAGGWTRTYHYEEPSLVQRDQRSNRLSRTTVGSTAELYQYDEHGNSTKMSHLSTMAWDYRDQLRVTSKQVISNSGIPETTWYVYDTTGRRVRKITERQAEAGQTPTRKSERTYCEAYEIYREFGQNGQSVDLRRDTLHIVDDERRLALVEIPVVDGNAGSATTPLFKYQFANQVESSTLELDNNAQIISYEEYFPHGSTSYQAVRSQVESAKRYRHSAKERDEESGLYYFGLRYYAPWLGRWLSCDPGGFIDGTNLYEYVKNNSIRHTDVSGMATKEEIEKIAKPHRKGKSQTTKGKHQEGLARKEKEIGKRLDKEAEQKRRKEGQRQGKKDLTRTEEKQQRNKEKKERYKNKSLEDQNSKKVILDDGNRVPAPHTKPIVENPVTMPQTPVQSPQVPTSPPPSVRTDPLPVTPPSTPVTHSPSSTSTPSKPQGWEIPASILGGIVVAAVAGIAVAALTADDATGIGVADDVLIPPSLAAMWEGGVMVKVGVAAAFGM